MPDAVALLQELGFSEYEARAYQGLLQHNPVTGYELAKVSGIPRPNIYPVLQKLEGRGAAIRIVGEDEEAIRYAPVPPEEFLKRIDDHLQATLSTAGPVLQTLAQPRQADYIWNTQGYSNLLAHARTLIGKTKEKLLIALWPDEARALAADLAQAEANHVQVTTLCLAACVHECGGCRGQIFRNKVVETEDARWLLLVPDSQEVLVGEIPARNEISVVRTRQRLLVEMTSWFIQHAIALGVLLREASEYLESRLAQEPDTVSTEADPQSLEEGWAYIRQLLRLTGGSSDSA